MSETSLLDELNRHILSSDQFSNYLLKTYGLPNLEDAYKAARLALLDEGELTSVTSMNRVIAAIRREITPQTTASMSSLTNGVMKNE